MLVSFTDEDEEAMAKKGYIAGESKVGKVYYPRKGVALGKHPAVNYVTYPWITCTEVSDVEIVKEELGVNLEWDPDKDLKSEEDFEEEHEILTF